MASVSYTSSALRDLWNQASKLHLTMFNTIRLLKICKFKSTHRSCRIGSNKNISILVRITTQPNYTTNLKFLNHSNHGCASSTTPCANVIVSKIPSSQSINTKDLNMCVMNCQSIINKAEYLVDYITEQDFDIVAMTEMWLMKIRRL